MPINLTKLIKNNTTKPQLKFSPKYFQKGLTGRGHNVGLIDKNHDSIQAAQKFQATNPKYIEQPQNKRELIYVTEDFDNIITTHRLDYIDKANEYHLTKKHNFILSPLDGLLSQGKANLHHKYRQLPYFLKNLNWQQSIAYPEYDCALIATHINFFRFNNKPHDNPKEQYFVNLVSVIRNHQQANNKYTNVIITNTDSINAFGINNFIKQFNLSKNHNFIIISTNPEMLHSLVNTDISLTETLTTQAKTCEQHLFDDISSLIKLTWSHPDKETTAKLIANNYHLIKIQDERRNEKDYQKFYNKLKTVTLHHHFNEPSKQEFNYTKFDFNQLVNVNTRLSLTRQLNLLNNDQSAYIFNPITSKLKTKQHYSREQLNVIHTTSPYVVAVAGAGSGKSHTLLGRLAYLKQNNINLSHVLVTSFTNTAAQNIINRFHGGINSLTNANLFHKIYQNNFSHLLTEDETLLNLLTTIPDNSVMMSTGTINDTRQQLIECLRRNITTGYQRVDPQSVTEHLVALVNHRFDDIIKLLDAIHETSLTLEPVIINAMMQMNKPIKYPKALDNLNFILTDESQDTSAFEYVLILQLAHLNHAQLMIIGDANQTLYEFRNANPRFLNTLERSNVFKTYTMSTNYRSKQDILTMANQFLDVLDTNKTANIQLHANQYSKVTMDTFQDTVKLHNIIPTNMHATIRPHETTDQADLRQTATDDPVLENWVIPKLQHHEQVAILTYRNRDAQALCDAVQAVATSHKIKLTTARTRVANTRPNTWISQMFSQTNSQLKSLYHRNHNHLTMQQIGHDFSHRLSRIADWRTRPGYPTRVSQTAAKIINKFLNSNQFQSRLAMLNRHQLNFNNFNGFCTMYLIQAETRHNNAQRLLQTTDETNWQDANLVVSTIHSAKGLEFPHVIVYFDETRRNATSQENLRLYGVALTRAEQSELILNKPRSQWNSNAGGKLPSSIRTDLVGMLKTPMRTAHQRVINNLKHLASQKTI